MAFEHLAKPGKIGKVMLKNRMVMPAMETWSAGPDGTVTETTINHYARRANGGVGLIITEMTNPSPGCRCFPGELEMSEDKYMPGMSKIADAIHSGGAKAFVQLDHGGVFARNNASDLPAFTPSGVGTFSLPDAELHEMTREDIANVVEDFATSALRAKAIGFDGVELHGGHGYLLVEFLSSYYNRRTDEYGGSVANRTRISLEIVEKIREYCGKDFPIIYKISSEDFTPGGITLDEAVEACELLEKAGVDAIMVSGGTLESRTDDFFAVMDGRRSVDESMRLTRGISTATWIPSTYCPRNLYTDNAAEIKKHVSIPVITVCSVRPEKAEEMIAAGEADFAALGRQILADPDYPTKVLEDRIEDMRQCLRCNECLGGGNKNRTLHCAVNPNLGNDYLESSTLRKCAKPKRIAVVGSGPAGINAAIAASLRGHSVTLYEKDQRLGGLMYYVGKPSFKEDYRRYTDYLIHTLNQLPVLVRMDCEFTEEIAETEQFDEIIVATGSETFRPSIPGAESPAVLDPLEVLDGHYPDVQRFLIAGAGLVGCEVAMHLAEEGRQVTMVDIVPNSNPANLYGVDWGINARLAEDGIAMELDCKIVEMGANFITCDTKKVKTPHNPNTGKGTERPYDFSGPYDGGRKTFEADAVVCALGLRPAGNLFERLIEKGYPAVAVGDAAGVRKIIDAVHEGYHAGRLA